MEYKFNSFYRDQYFFELERKQTLTNSLSIPLVVVSGMGSIVIYFSNAIHEYELPYTDPLVVLFMILLIPFVWFFVRIIVFLFKAYYIDKEYGYVDKMKEINNFENRNIQYYREIGKTEEEAFDLTAIDISVEIEKKYIEATELNCTNNNERSGYLSKANDHLKWLLICVLFCTLPFIIIFSIYKKPTKQQVEILIKQLEVKMSQPSTENTNQSGTNPKDSTTTNTTQSKPLKPVFPENTLIKENEIPKKK